MKIKDKEVTILEAFRVGDHVAGLGSDDKVYVWEPTKGNWYLYKLIKGG